VGGFGIEKWFSFIMIATLLFCCTMTPVSASEKAGDMKKFEPIKEIVETTATNNGVLTKTTRFYADNITLEELQEYLENESGKNTIESLILEKNLLQVISQLWELMNSLPTSTQHMKVES